MLPPLSAVNHVDQRRGIRRELPPRIHRTPTLLLGAGKCRLHPHRIKYSEHQNYTIPTSLCYCNRPFSASSFSDCTLEALRGGVLSLVLTDAVVGAY